MFGFDTRIRKQLEAAERAAEELASRVEVLQRQHSVDLQILNMMEGGNQVAVEFVLEVNLPAWGGGHYRDEEIHLWTFDDQGKVVRLRHYTDTAKQIASFKG